MTKMERVAAIVEYLDEHELENKRFNRMLGTIRKVLQGTEVDCYFGLEKLRRIVVNAKMHPHGPKAGSVYSRILELAQDQ